MVVKGECYHPCANAALLAWSSVCVHDCISTGISLNMVSAVGNQCMANEYLDEPSSFV